MTAYVASAIYHVVLWNSAPRAEIYIPFSLFLAFLYTLICIVDDQYILAGEKWRQDGVARGLGALVLAFMFFVSMIFLFSWEIYFSRGAFLLQIALTSMIVVVARIIIAQQLERSIRSGHLQGRGLIVISLSNGASLADYTSKLCSASDEIVGWFTVESHDSQSTVQKSKRGFANIIAGIRTECRKLRPDIIIVIYDAIRTAEAEQFVEAFYELPVNIRLLPIGMFPYMQRSRVIKSGIFSTLQISTRAFSLFGRFMKRTLDLAGAIFAVVLLSPLLLFVAIAIKLDSPGPILFRQTRHGFNNEPIQVLKFRTMKMRKDREPFRQTAKGDPRVTRVGRLIRKTNIDELPQLFNVIRGDMSLVGPRPHALEHNEAFANRIKMIYRRHNVKPGITGWAQVNGFRGATNTCGQMQKRIEYDLYYVDNWSIFLDIKILIMTLLSKKAYVNAY